jgi:exo-beta-1,3-glucanase (GH17 family)
VHASNISLYRSNKASIWGDLNAAKKKEEDEKNKVFEEDAAMIEAAAATTVVVALVGWPAEEQTQMEAATAPTIRYVRRST